jgi:DNA phosphorothioation-dependent restriction protein DptH
LSQNAADTVTSNVAQLIFETFLNGMPEGRRIRIESVDQAFANQLAVALRELVSAQGEIDQEDLILVAVIDEQNPDGDLRISVAKAIELRNRRSRILFLDPESVGATDGSLGVNSFDTRSLLEIYAGVIKVLRKRVKSIEGGEEVLRALSRNTPSSTSVLSQAELLIELVGSEDLQRCLGENLWRVGLIPDHGQDILERLASNARVSDTLSGRSRPLSSGGDRLSAAGIAPGGFRDRLQSLLEPLPMDFNRWLGNLSKDESFHLWPLSTETVHEIEELAVIPFIGAGGKIDPKCKLRLDHETNTLVAKGQISAYWATKPTTPASVAEWLVELAPPNAIADDFPVLLNAKSRKAKRMLTFKLEFSPELLENIAPRYVIRVSALDASGSVLKLLSGSPAVAESQEFALDLNRESDPIIDPNQVPRGSFSGSIPEGILEKILNGTGKISETSPTWDTDKQVFSLSVNPFEKIQIPVSRFIISAQQHSFSNPEKAFWHSVKSPSGTEVSFTTATSMQLELPENLQKFRTEFLKLAESKNQARLSVEAMSWDDELRLAAHSYLAQFRKALEENLAPKDLNALLLHDTVSVSTSSPRGTVQGVVLLPTHPLRLCWVAEHDKLLREWMSSVIAFKEAQRKSEIDFPLVKRITPSNFPFLVVGGDAIDQLKPFSYSGELTHGSALYLDASSSDSQLESLSIRRVLGIRGDSTLSSDTTAVLVSERMQRYRRAHMDSPGLRMLVVNPADAQVAASATRRLVGSLGPEESGMKLELVGYGPVSSFANPMANLALLQRELSQGEGVPARNEVSELKIVSRDLDDISNDSSEAHLTLVQGVASLKIAPTQGPKGLSATLRGLLTPITSSKWEHDNQLGFFTKPAIETKNSLKKSELVLAHAALLSSLSKSLFGSNSPAGLQLQVDPSTLDRLRAAHSRSDWVLTLDRNIGLSLYEDLIGDALGGAYVLDYAPDFIDGLGDRLTVTTTRRDELERVISGAMTKLGLRNEGIGAPELLRTLASVSGRLALRLLGDDTSSIEALGLAATISHLSQNGELKNTVLIPVDAHLDIFGTHARKDEESAERCDVLLLRLTQTGHSIEFLEVKARSGNIDTKLFKTMAFQVNQTYDLIKSRLFGKDQPRVDNELQWARWCSLLHFYADRASLHGYIDEAKLMEIHASIDRIEINREQPAVTKSGYIVALQGKPTDVPVEYEGLNLYLLNAERFEEMGFTTQYASGMETDDDTSVSRATSLGETQIEVKSSAFIPEKPQGSIETSETAKPSVRPQTPTPVFQSVEYGDIVSPKPEVLSAPDKEVVPGVINDEKQAPSPPNVIVIQLGEEIM